MLAYLSYHRHLLEGEIVDEMLSILSDRKRIMQKKELFQKKKELTKNFSEIIKTYFPEMLKQEEFFNEVFYR